MQMIHSQQSRKGAIYFLLIEHIPRICGLEKENKHSLDEQLNIDLVYNCKYVIIFGQNNRTKSKEFICRGNKL